jgi:accessory gene regulator protein AgrB
MILEFFDHIAGAHVDHSVFVTVIVTVVAYTNIALAKVAVVSFLFVMLASFVVTAASISLFAPSTTEIVI